MAANKRMEYYMRNYFVLIVLLLFVLSGCAVTKQAPVVPPEELTLQEVHEIALSKDAIFARSLEWMARSFADSAQTIELRDKENGKIIGKGMTEFYNGEMPTPCRFTIMIEAKDNKYRVTYSNFTGMWGAARNLPRPLWHAGHIEQVKAKLKILDATLHAYLSEGKNRKDW